MPDDRISASLGEADRQAVPALYEYKTASELIFMLAPTLCNTIRAGGYRDRLV